MFGMAWVSQITAHEVGLLQWANLGRSWKKLQFDVLPSLHPVPAIRATALGCLRQGRWQFTRIVKSSVG